MNATKIVIPFDFPFAILENPNEKRVYAVADGQYTYGPLSLFQFHNDEKYSKIMESEKLPPALPCKEYYIVESGHDIKDTIEIIDEKRGKIHVREMKSDIPQEQNHDLKSNMLTENRHSHRNLFTRIKKAFNTPTRSQSATSSRILKNVKPSSAGQQSPSYATPKRSLRK